MAKQVIFHEDARAKLKNGIDVVANAVRVTIGPRGRNVALDRGYGGPMITNDGVSIAKEISLKDKFENMGAEIIKEVAQKTNDIAGDGTTTATVLTHALISEGMRHTALGVNAMTLRRGIEKAATVAVEALKKAAKPIKDKDEIKQVATISAESEEIGRIIANTIEKVGKDGVVTVEEAQSLSIEEPEVVKGLEFDKGYVSAYMITNAERMEAEFKDPAILITDKKVSNVKEILPFLEKVTQSGVKELVIIADDIEGEALTTFVVNKLRGGFSVLGIKAPGYGDRKKEMLEDIATTVGGTVLTESTGLTFETADLSILGKASRIVSTKDSTLIVGGKGKKADIEARVEAIKAQRTKTTSKYDKEKLDERIAKLSGGVAVIRVGAPTETEMKYLKLKIEDAVNATKAAIAEGVVAGGGSALVKTAQKVYGAMDKLDDADLRLGYSIVIDALVSPLKQIAANSGKGDGSIIVEKVLESKKENAGYDALNDKIVDDMLLAGIIDPVKVTRTALQNAASAAGIFLTTEVAITDIPEEKKENGAPDMGGMGY
ncbi:MAG: chaperonin GroEL [Candidatus Zambryskibacteria bacterium CG10_big_fil_rev_8_21_14_0_10_42_12]|uniref:Chaperonin GroEL n=1 Tax=Candidatus Zambryskibacteria bacterium CG10_big_fil_rev_8_21_14_0_10_42_12 TaxID=1975115 RepID=A0A2H0QUK6_9BACT|nr:MAG: chaperonin GroEL [Candidatus Zambryskibacteria bacterium CG10_big_fil_rev_8_21_14_0_10_42_12]